MIIQQFCRTIDNQLCGLDSLEEKLESAAKALSQIFGVRRDEVAIFAYDPRFEILRFNWPVQLRSAGFVPLSARDALVAMTARHRKPFLDNYFAQTPHLHIFETFQLERTGGLPIQKIMSVPMVMEGGELRGALQISRKGETLDSAGMDFTPQDLDALLQLASIIALHF
jgi:hypothetical protein